MRKQIRTFTPYGDFILGRMKQKVFDEKAKLYLKSIIVALEEHHDGLLIL